MIRTLLFHTVVAAVLVSFSALPAPAGEKPLIWDFTRSGEAAFGARVGAHLSTPWKSSAGIDVAMSGPRIFGKEPITAWGSVELPGRDTGAFRRHTELRVSARGESGPRTATISHSVRTMLPGVDAELDQVVTVRSIPHDHEGPVLRSTQTLKFTAVRSRTILTARTTASSTEKRKTTFGMEQPISDALRLHATVEQPAQKQRKGRVSATYSFKW